MLRSQNALPEIDNYQYQYTPGPTNQICPVSSHEFNTLFYHKGFSVKRDLEALSDLWLLQKKVLQRLPKRLSPLDNSTDAPEVFWGLYACNKISFLGVFCYHLVSFMISIVFAILLDMDDVQGVFSILAYWTSLVTLFWAMLSSETYTDTAI